MKKCRRLTCLFLGLVLAMGAFSGCNKTPQSDTSSSSGMQGDDTNFNNTNLVIYTSNANDTFKNAVEEANKNWNAATGGKISYIDNGDWNTRYTKLSMLIATGEQVDIYPSNYMDSPTLVLKNILLPVDDYLEDTEYVSTDLSRKGYGFRGKTYGFVSQEQANPCVIVYNKTMFENNGEKTPLEYYREGNWTWETFRQVAINMTQDQNNDGVTDQYGFATWLQHLFLPTAGLSDYLDQNINLTLSDPRFVKVANFVQQCGFRDKSFVRGTYDWEEYFANGMVAMIGERPYMLSTFAYKGMTDEIDFAPYPQDPENTSDVKYAAWVDGTSIVSNTVNSRAAAEFIKKYWIPALSGAQKKAREESTVWNGYTDEQKALISEILPNAYCMNSLGYQDFELNTRTLWGKIYRDGESVSTAIASMTPVLQSSIDRTLADTDKEGVTKFEGIDTIDFEAGLAPMVENISGVASLDGKAIAGNKSLTLTCPKVESGAEPPVLVYTDPTKAALPSGHNYKISVKYSLEQALTGYNTVYFQIRSKAELNNAEAGTSDTLVLDSASATSGTLQGTINLPVSNLTDDYVLVVSFTGEGGTVTIDDIAITE